VEWMHGAEGQQSDKKAFDQEMEVTAEHDSVKA